MRKLTLLSKLSSLRQAIVVGSLVAPFIDHNSGFVPYPYIMTLVVTRRCNSRCQMCSIWRDKTSSSLSLEQIEHIFSRDDFSFVRSMTLTGGEPTLRADLPQLFGILLERLPGLEHVLLAVNGLDTPRTVEHISQMSEIMDTSDNRVRSFDVQVSLDGIGRVHDIVRGVPGSFQNVKATLAQLSALQARSPRLNLWLHCTLMPHNLPYVDSLRHFVKQHSLQITYGVVAFSREYYDNLHKIGDLSFSEGHRDVARRFFEQLGREDRTMFCFHYRDLAQMLQGNPRFRRCMMGFYGFVIEHDGNAYPCLRYKRSGFGNLLADSFEEVWFGTQAQDARRHLRMSCCPTCPSDCLAQPINAREAAEAIWWKGIIALEKLNSVKG